MKRITIVLGALAVLALVILAGMGLFRHFVTDRITDGGDMTNPFLPETTAKDSFIPIKQK